VLFTALPFGLTCVGDKEQVVLEGAPLQESDTLPVKPKRGLTVSVVVPECPREIVRDAGEVETEKSSTFCVITAEELPWKLELLDANVAVTEWVPPASELVENCATPLESVDVCEGVLLPSK
jgi:hypothetical protein